jgi:hypothetical protein
MPAERPALVARPGPDGATVLFDLVASQMVWWWCVLAVRQGEELVGLAAPLAYVAGRVAVRPARAAATLKLAVAGALFGATGDQVLASVGLLDFLPAGTLGVFMVSLWAMFAVSLEHSAAFLGRLSPLQRALAGAVAGPLAYLGGERLGVLALERGAYLGVAVEWALALLVLPVLVSRSHEREATG